MADERTLAFISKAVSTSKKVLQNYFVRNDAFDGN